MNKMLLVGLGNHGSRYDGTRHNVGFEVIDNIAKKYEIAKFSSKFKGEISSLEIGGKKIILLKPFTYMNLSGVSVQEASSFYKIPSNEVLVIHDDIDLECGRVKIKIGGSGGGHNGLKSIDQNIGNQYWRLRIGVSRPTKQEVSSYVLSSFTDEQKNIIDSTSDHIAKNLLNLLLEKSLGLPAAKIS